MVSTESLAEDAGPRHSTWTSSVQPAYYNGQLVAVKHIKKPFVALTKEVVAEINQVLAVYSLRVTSWIKYLKNVISISSNLG